MERAADIGSALDRIEHEHAVRVLYACESGSRAWGFASPDSDFDVRFVYAHPVDWYLSIDLERKRDVIELPIDQDLDVSGWDLRKALGLLRKSNPPLLEWLASPIVYLDRYDTAAGLRGLVPAYFSPLSCGYHYLSMARRNYREYLQGERVRIKKYFYVLRPLLAVKWIELGLGAAPTEFAKLCAATVKDPALSVAIEDLLQRKQQSLEADYAHPLAVLNRFVESELDRLENSAFSKKGELPDPGLLNVFFRSKLAEVWNREPLAEAVI